MLSFLKNHPFPVEAFFESSLVITYAVPKEEVEGMLPAGLELDIFKDKWAFLAIALVETKGLRPKGFPRFMGNNFLLAGYRLFVRYTNSKGKRLRGLYILKSQTDKRKMKYFGNFFTHYQYELIDLKLNRSAQELQFSDAISGLNIHIVRGEGGQEIALPETSPFTDWKEARRFAGPLPFTFTEMGEKGKMLVIEGVRQNWVPKPVEVLQAKSPFMDSLHLKGAVLANAFVIDKIPYYWKKGVIDKWKP